MLVHITGTTCGLNCWHATEDVFRCSCGGANHGCLRRADGVQPARTSKIGGVMHELAGVGEVESEAIRINVAAGKSRIAHTAREHWGEGEPPAKMRPSTLSQVDTWPELSAYRAQVDRFGQRSRPYLLWIVKTSVCGSPVLKPADDSPPLVLSRPAPSGRAPLRFSNNVMADGSKRAQKVLFTGLDCLPGQGDLFG